MVIEVISCLISTKVWDRALIKLTTPGSAVRLIIDCATWPGNASCHPQHLLVLV